MSMAVGALLAGCAEDEAPIYGGLYGTIRNAETGAVVYNAELTLAPGHPSPVTGTNGAYVFQNLEARQYTLTVRAVGYLDDSRQVNVYPGENTQCDILLTPERDIEGVNISTKTLDFGSGLSHLTVTLYNTGNTPVDWHISTKTAVAWLSISPMSGSTDAGKSSDISVSVDRSKMSDDSSAIFIINAAGGSKSVVVNVSKSGGNGGNNGNGGNDESKDVTSGLYAYYMFNDNLQNAVDGAPNATGVNGPTFVDGIRGTKALRLRSTEDGKYSYISIPEGLINDGSYTVAFWIKGLSDGSIFHTENSNSNAYHYELFMSNARLAYGAINWYSSSGCRFNHSTFDQSEWYHIALTSNKTSDREAELKLYVNGEYTDVGTYSYGERQLKFIVGGEYADGYESTYPPVMMTIDNLRVYSARALSDKEVKQVYNFEK